MGIGLKLGLGFLVVAVLVAVVGFIGIQSIHRTRITAALVADVDNLLLRVTEKDSMVSSAVSTQDLDSFEPLKVRAEQLNVEIHTVIADLQQTDELDDELDFVSFLANEASLDVVHSQLMANHDELLTRRDLFSETPLLEQSMRFQIEAKLLEVGDPDIIDDFRSMSYHSKEALYQYQDQEHFEEWFAATNKVAEGLEVNRVGYTSEQQRVLLNQLQVYLDTARILGQITLREREIKAEQAQLLPVMRGHEAQLTALRDNISDLLVNEVSESSQRSWNFLLVTTLGTIVSALGVGLVISRSVSNPIAKLSHAADQLGQGDLTTRVDIKANEVDPKNRTGG